MERSDLCVLCAPHPFKAVSSGFAILRATALHIACFLTQRRRGRKGSLRSYEFRRDGTFVTRTGKKQIKLRGCGILKREKKGAGDKERGVRGRGEENRRGLNMDL